MRTALPERLQTEEDRGPAPRNGPTARRVGLRSVPRLPAGARYLLPPAASILVYLAQLYLRPRTGMASFGFFYVGVAVSALLGGRGPGFVAVALSATVANYAVFEARESATSFVEPIATAIFLCGGSFLTLLCAACREAAVRAQRTAEELSRQSSVLAMSHDVIVVWRPDTGIEEWNRGAEELYGFTCEEARGRSPAELLHTRYPGSWSEIAAHLAQYGRWEGELVETTKDGRGVVVAARFQYVHGRDGVDRILESSRDISERARARDELLQKEQRLRAIFENVSLGIAEVDAEGKVQDANLRLREMLAYDSEQLQSLNITELFAPEEREVRRELNDKLKRGDLDGYDFECRLLKKGGALLWVHVTVTAVRGSASSRSCAVVTMEDVTERRLVQHELGRKQALLQGVYDNIPVLLVLWDPHLRRFTLNRRAEAVLGLSTAEANEEDLMSRVYPDPSYRAQVTSFMQSLEPGFREWFVTTKRGDQVPIEWANVRLSDDTALGIGVDLRERKRTEEELRRANEQLLESDRRKNEFLAVLSHELRNPLAPVRNSIYVMERAAPGGEQSRRALTVIDRQVAHMARLIDDLLDVTRISRGKVRLQRELLLLNDIVRGTADDFRELFRRQGTQLDVSVPERRLRAFIDRIRIAQVVGNLLSNAVKFTPSGGRVALSLSADGNDHALIEVRDTGVGIEPHVLGRLFEPFVQADKTLDRTEGGLGLGLALVKGLVELHGGTVWAGSEGAGMGATLCVRLPLEVSAEPARDVVGQRQPAATGARSLRVLLIEDNADAADSMREALELNGHQVESAATGVEGIEKAYAFNPEVVLCDIGLPGIDGFEVARRMRGDPVLRSARLVALSGYAAPDDLAKSRAAGFVRHLAKPPDLATLEATLLELSIVAPA